MSVQPISGGLGSLPPTAPNQAAQLNVRPTEGQVAVPPIPEATVTLDGHRSLSPAEYRSSVEDAVKRANETVQVLRSNLQFSVDEATGIDVVKFIDVKTKEVIRQIPSEEMLALARRLDEIKGLLIKDKA